MKRSGFGRAAAVKRPRFRDEGFSGKEAIRVTREHKLALIIGFSLVLVVGVLISDHFSRARVDQMATVTDDGPSNLGSGLDGLKAVAVPQTALVATRGGTLFSNPETPLPPVDEPPPTRSTEIVLGVGNPFAKGTPEMSATDSGIQEPSVPQNPQAGAVRAVNPDLARGQGGMSGEPIPGFTPEPQGAPMPPKEEVINGVPRSMLTRHDVKDGESVYRIAAEKYGDGNLWTKLRDFNPGKIAANGSMRAGVTLLCPPKEYMLGKPLPTGMPQTTPTGKPAATPATAVATGKTGAKPEPAKSEPKPEAKATKTEKTTKVGTYKVQRGDHLGEIAAKTLGSSKRANEIYELNKDLMSDEDSLTVGMTLKLPTR